MTEMKYVVVDFEGKVNMFIFPKSVNHDYFVESLGALRHTNPANFNDWSRIYPNPVSAGFTDGVKCYGRSESLNLDSKTDDAILLRFGGHRG